jgi:LmbE family N-acetylglucosaminyl deacetylase
MPMRLQLVVAHPDDETFGCGSLLLHAAAAGATTVVTCATRGEAGEPPAGSDLTPGELGRVRERELAAAAEALGVGEVELLDFADSGMSGEAGPETLVGAAYDDVVASVLASVERRAPDVLVTLDASDGHRDHARIRDAALEAASRAGVRRVYLACLPRSLMQRWCDHMAAHRPDVEHLDADVAGLGTPDELLTTAIDARVHREAREKAMALHASQTSPYDGLPGELRDDFLDTVHARRVAPAWAGGPRETSLVLKPGWWDLTQARWVG